MLLDVCIQFSPPSQLSSFSPFYFDSLLFFLRLYFVFVERGRACAVPSNVPAQGCALRTIGQFIPRSFYTVSILLRCICPDHFFKQELTIRWDVCKYNFKR